MKSFLGSIFALSLLIAGSCDAQVVALPKNLKDPTGVCLRRLTWTDAEGNLESRYEVVLARQSSNLAKDMDRVKQFEAKDSRAMGPDVLPFKWIPAWLYDDYVDGTKGPDCSKLPIIHKK